MTYRIRYTRSTNHIEGIPERSTGPAADNSQTTGVVGYYATSACPALSRTGHTMGVTGDETDSLAAVLEDARTAGSRTLCKNCEKAAARAMADAYTVAQNHARHAADLLEASENFEDEPRIAVAEERAERFYEAYRDAADAVGRCLVFGCDSPCADGRSYCPEHDDTSDIDPEPAPAPAPVEEPASAPATYAAELAALPVGAQVQLYTTNGVVRSGAIAGTGSEGVMLTSMDRRRQVAYSAVESFEYFVEDTELGGRWFDPITDADAPKLRRYECPERTVVDGIGYPCVNDGEHVEHNTALGAAWWTPERPVTGTVEDAVLGFAYADARKAYMRASERLEETGEDADRLAADDAWGAFIAAADRAGKCRAFTCYEDAEPGATECARHTPRPEPVEPVVARLDHTEPGKATALITGGHGRAQEPQAWLSHGGGAWVLADDYDGVSYSVTGPDAERAVRAWAVLLDIALDDVEVTVEYAGGPVSPTVPAVPEARSVTLEWVRDREEVNVFTARGKAHDYRITEHYDGASLIVHLRGPKGGPVEVYRRRYTTRPGARRAAQSFEHRYGPVYAPAG